MSTPVSIQDGPFTTNTLASKSFIVFYITIIWGSTLPLLLEIFAFWKLVENNSLMFICLLPFQIYFGYITLVLTSILIAKILLIIINLVHKPKEGVFKRTNEDPDYFFWSLRAVIKKWPIWISKFIPLPIIDKINLKWFNNDSEFIEYDNNVSFGKGSSIKASMVFNDFLIIKKVNIGENVIIGSNSFIAPGTQIGKNAIIGTMSATKVNQTLKSNSHYTGFPINPVNFQDRYSNDSIEKLRETIFKMLKNNDEWEEKSDSKQKKLQREKFEKNLIFDLFIFGTVYFVSNAIPILGIIYFGSELFIPFFLQSPNIYSIFTNSLSLIIFIFTPLIFILFYVINLLVVILISKLYYRIIQYINPCKEGVFDWENKNKDFKYYFRRSFLLRYVRWKIKKSPFPWLLKFAFNFIGNCQIGRNTVIEDGFIAKEFLEVGNNVYLGKVLIANHLWDKNLTIKKITIGNNVVIPDNCCIAPGTEIEQNVSLLPLSITVKCKILRGNSIYYNSPLTKITNEELIQVLNLNMHDLTPIKYKNKLR
ncbi:MAG: acyltransferase [Promethearchaeota archaeon]